jgi:CubicO group peptidase (beta-lactamase class C family)
MLLEARSGIYHGYVAGTPGMREGWPKRDSHAAGTFWFYNNWDFNALGTIFETTFKTPIAKAFEDRIAVPTGMQDFRMEDMYYVRAASDASPDINKSIHPAYHFRLSARDVARFGYLFLQHGEWKGMQVVPRAWVDESTHVHSETRPAEGYGYLWWIDGFGLPEKSFSAQGALAKYLVVVPSRDLVVVYLNHTEFPDDASGLSMDTVKGLPSISHDQMSQLLNLLLEAQRP